MEIREALNRMRTFIDQQGLFARDDGLLLAVSGGRDSMCALYLLDAGGYHVSVAHVNYGLRGAESEDDARFVEIECRKKSIPCYMKEIDLATYAEEQRLSVQEAARNVRYAFFTETLQKEDLDVVVTAHHRDDSLETFFINILRGTGLRGATGIPVRRGRIVRPLMCFVRDEIDQIVHHNNIPFREDHSNLSDAYLRNRIRHFLIPVLDDIMPGGTERILNNMSRLSAESQVLQNTCEAIASEISSVRGSMTVIDMTRLHQIPGSEVILLFISEPFGFNFAQCADLMGGHHQAGRRYLSRSHTMYVDRGEILIEENFNNSAHDKYIVLAGESVMTPEGLLEITRAPAPVELSAAGNTEYVDADTTGERFVLRRWRAGDRFQPLGLSGTQKLQDFFVNERISIPEKERTWVLTSSGEIVWIVGHRLDDRFKINEKTDDILELHWTPAAKISS